jgi:flagellar protein FlbD
MITLTRTDGAVIIINADEIEMIESRPDTVITLRSNRKILVKESPNTITDLVIDYRRICAEKK